MRPLSVTMLVVLGILSAVLGGVLASFVTGRGAVLPVTGWVSGLLLLGLGAVLLVAGLPLRRYMKESEARREHPTLAPRRHSLDMITAYRTIVLARACAYTGAIIGGVQLGQLVFLASSGIGTLAGALLPTGFAALCGIALAVLGAIVEHWGTLPPDDGEGEARSTTA
jgi:hypothetical protein